MEKLNEVVRPSMLFHSQWQLRIIDEITKSQAFVKELREFHTPTHKKFRKEWGWLVGKRPFRVGNYWYSYYKKRGNNKFRDALCRWFSSKRNQNYLLNEMNTVFPEKRIEIIKEGFKYHRDKRYSISIPLLLPQVEGVLWDLGAKKGKVRKAYNSREKKSGGEWELPELSKEIFPNDKFHKIIVREIYSEKFRHPVLHGRNIHKGKEKEISRWRSTLLILTLWRLSDEFKS